MADAGAEDPESGINSEGSAGAPGLQRRLTSLLVSERVDRLCADLLEGQQWSAARRTRELRDPGVNHDWLWGLKRAHGTCMPLEEYLAAVRLRLGAHFVDDPVVCGWCGRAHSSWWVSGVASLASCMIPVMAPSPVVATRVSTGKGRGC